VDCRIWLTSMFVHDRVTRVDVHDADTAGWITEYAGLGAVASDLEGSEDSAAEEGITSAEIVAAQCNSQQLTGNGACSRGASYCAMRRLRRRGSAL
jgi:hypothetical protein